MSCKKFSSNVIEKRKLKMWWQGKNQGSPRQHGYAEFHLEGSSDSEVLLFKGKFYNDATTYTIGKGEIKEAPVHVSNYHI